MARVTSRLPLVFITALVLMLSACNGSTEKPPTSATPTATSTVNPTIKVAVPHEPPSYGSQKNGDAWRSSGYAPKPVKTLPFADGVLLDGQLAEPVDRDGVRDYELNGTHYYHPVAIAQFALAQLDQANSTGSKAALQSAEVNAAKLLEVGTPVGDGIYFAYPFDFALGGFKDETIRAPWWSAMAQGEALSLFVRLAKATGDQKWADAADKTFATLDDRGPRAKPWSIYVDQHQYLWFEEYAGNTDPLLVLNGDMFALFGIWDYQQLTGSTKATRLFDAGVTTLRAYLPSFRKSGDVSYYCLRQPLCRKKQWQNKKYHGIVIEQMHIIADMTDDTWFAHEADRFASDFAD